MYQTDGSTEYKKPHARRSFQFKALIRKNLALSFRGVGSLCHLILPFMIIVVIGVIQLVIDSQWSTSNSVVESRSEEVEFFFGEENFLFFSNPGGSEKIGYLYSNHSGEGLLGYIEQFHNAESWNPYFDEYSSRSKLQSGIVTLKNEYVQSASTGQVSDVILPAAALVFNQYYINQTNNFTFGFEVMVDESWSYNDYNDDQIALNYVGSIYIATTAFLKQSIDQDWDIKMSTRPFPYQDDGSSYDLPSRLAVLFFPICLSLLLPLYVYQIVIEKQNSMLPMMLMMSLKMRNFWMSWYVYNMVLYFIVSSIVVLTCIVFGFTVFVHGSLGGTTLVIALWGNAQIGMAFLLSLFFNRVRTSLVVCYSLVALNVVISSVFNLLVFTDSRAPFWFYLYPPFALSRYFSLIGPRCADSDCPIWADYTASSEYVAIMFYLLGTSIFLLILSLYLDSVLPKSYGIQKSPFFPFTYLRDLFSTYFSNKKAINEPFAGYPSSSPSSPQSFHLLNAFPIDALEEDSDVTQERMRVNEDESANSPVLVMNLTKKYEETTSIGVKTAVDCLSLAIRQGECFGLLGPNGAGKTTTISMLTGLIPSSEGTALIGGYNIRTEMDRIHRIIGVCPQFDTLWDQLTVAETLLFYARMKGVPGDKEGEHVEESIRRVGLENFSDRKVKILSGGMRRRLSVAISLIGDPQIIFLDEPTTGVDPETRRQLWDVLLRLKERHVIILTTHSMEEADILCSRIGIMSRGRLRCIGPQQHLKRRYGSGYTLKISYSQHNEEKALQFIEKLLPTSMIQEQFLGSCRFQIPGSDLKISIVFEQMEKNKKRAGIDDWSLSQTSLDEVFLNIVADDEYSSQM